MTPAARIAAAIGILDRVVAGEAAEAVLTRWGRDNRYAGSGDRAAIRDHVFDALRRRRSLAALGGAGDGRGLMIGALRAAGVAPDTVFTGARHAPAPLTAAEQAHVPPDPLPLPVACDMPDWLADRFAAALGAAAVPAMMALRDRAPVHLRVNTARATRPAVLSLLSAAGIAATPHPDVPTAIVLDGPARGLRDLPLWQDGLVELQDAASQAAVLALPLSDGDRVLDYCAGGGGKTLAMGARARLDLVAHDADPARMADIAPRAARAGLAVRQVATARLAAQGPFDLVLVDAPCSGSGTWRRAPEAKWRLTPAALAALCDTQAAILPAAAALVRPGGYLAYATCSVLREENEDRIAAFRAANPGWTEVGGLRLAPDAAHDGFYLCVMNLSV